MVFCNRILAQEVLKKPECALSPRRRCEKSLLLLSVALRIVSLSTPPMRERHWLRRVLIPRLNVDVRFARPPLWECNFWSPVRSYQGTGTIIFHENRRCAFGAMISNIFLLAR